MARKADEPVDLSPDARSAGLDPDQPDHFGNLIASLPQGDETKHHWIEDEMYPRRTGFLRREAWTLVQAPPIDTRPGDIVLLREYVVVKAVIDGVVFVEAILGDETLADPDYYIVGSRAEEDAAAQG